MSTTSSGETLLAITTINSLAVAAPLSAGTQSQSVITADNSANPSYAYDGLLTTALKPGSNAYVNVMPTGTAGTGTPLTASGRGSIVEIDTMFQKMWDNFQVVASTSSLCQLAGVEEHNDKGALECFGSAAALR